jgi:hypothetical protein
MRCHVVPHHPSVQRRLPATLMPVWRRWQRRQYPLCSRRVSTSPAWGADAPWAGGDAPPPGVALSDAERSSGKLSPATVDVARASLEHNGVCYFEGVLGEEWVSACAGFAEQRFDACMARDYPGGQLAVGMENGYSSVVHRAQGRYDIQEGVRDQPLMLEASQLWLPLVERVLVRAIAEMRFCHTAEAR